MNANSNQRPVSLIAPCLNNCELQVYISLGCSWIYYEKTPDHLSVCLCNFDVNGIKAIHFLVFFNFRWSCQKSNFIISFCSWTQWCYRRTAIRLIEKNRPSACQTWTRRVPYHRQKQIEGKGFRYFFFFCYRDLDPDSLTLWYFLNKPPLIFNHIKFLLLAKSGDLANNKIFTELVLLQFLTHRQVGGLHIAFVVLAIIWNAEIT